MTQRSERPGNRARCPLGCAASIEWGNLAGRVRARPGWILASLPTLPAGQE